MNLPRGMFPLLETPFDETGAVDFASLERLTEDVVTSGVGGVLAPLVASEVHSLTVDERRAIVELASRQIRRRIAFVAGASSDDPDVCRGSARLAGDLGCDGYLVAVPAQLYSQPEAIVPFFETVAAASDASLIIQDLQWNGPGLTIETMQRLRDKLPTLAGFKIETIPSGPKYTAVREALGPDFHISGGWAIPQLIEALDRGVDAMVPESALVRVFQAIYRAHASGDRAGAVQLFRQLLPVLVFSNQELFHSIAFFKRLLVRKGLLRTADMRPPGYQWDRYRLRIADELIDYYLDLESRQISGVAGETP